MLDWTPEEIEGTRSFIEKWKYAGPMLEADRERRIRETDTARDVWMFDIAARHALQTSPPLPTSGLMALHAWLDPQRAATGAGG